MLNISFINKTLVIVIEIRQKQIPKFPGSVPFYLIFYFVSLHKKISFPLRISFVNVTKSAVSCEFGHIYRRNP